MRTLAASSLLLNQTRTRCQEIGQSYRELGLTPATIGRQPMNYWDEFGPSWAAGVVDQFKEHGVTLKQTAKSTFRLFPDTVRENLGRAHDKIYEIEWDHLPTELKHWISSHPYQTAFHIANGIVFFAPAASSGPVLWGLGFTAQGPRVGSIASSLQGMLGSIGVKSGFAYLQSAAMGGYGANAVNIGTRASAALASCGRMWNPKEDIVVDKKQTMPEEK